MRKDRRLLPGHTTAFWLFVTPSLLLFTVFFLVPLGLAVYLSFTNYDGWKTLDWRGLTNYQKLLRDTQFFRAIGRTFVYTLVSLPGKVLWPLLIALLVTSARVRFKTLTRSLCYVPVLLSALVVGITINWMFSQEYGLVNYLLLQLGFQPLPWSLDSSLATAVVSIATNWSSAGFYMVIFIGGLNNISQELYEAGAIDGANSMQTFLRITLPLLKPTTFLVVLLSTINLLKEYTLVQGITQGGPGLSTTYIIQHIFKKGFDQFEYGYASAMSLAVMLLFIALTFAQFKLSRGGEIA
ncbi:MAG: carbohydrate ABC transporter permease [Christensenellales bacterium]|jgi:alpha-1,4-digalacturonate transport system permease protein